MNQGYPFIQIDTHGGPSHWQTESPSQNFTETHINQIVNPTKSVIVTASCLSNAFDSLYSCLSESFMKRQNSGIIGYFGSSRWGFYSTNPNHLGASYEYNGEFYRYLLLNPEHRFIHAANASKITKLASCDGHNPYRSLLFSINPIGDPEMPLFVAQPQTFHPVTLYCEGGVVHVDTGVDNCRICVRSKDDGGNTYYAIQDNVRTAIFNTGLAECEICITKGGYIPYITTLPSETRIQSVMISNNTTIFEPGEVLIGSHVKPGRTPGPVGVQNCTFTINKGKKVTITDAFLVKNGAKFIIQ